MTTASVQEMGHAAQGGCNRPASEGGSMSDARVNRPQEGNNDSDAKEFSQDSGRGGRSRHSWSSRRQDGDQGRGDDRRVRPRQLPKQMTFCTLRKGNDYLLGLKTSR